MKQSNRYMHQEQMYALVRKYQSSGQSQLEFCQGHELKPATLHYWIRKLSKEKKEPPSFIKLEVRPPESEFPSRVAVIRFANGTVVELPI